MRPVDFIPQDEAALVISLNNFAAKLPGYATLFGLTAAEVTAVANDTRAAG